MMDADKLVEILERLRLMSTYVILDANKNEARQVILAVEMSPEEFTEFKELF